MRLITLVFVALVILIQYPLWLGKGGWLRVHELDRQVQVQNKSNDELRARNDKLAAEVRDLKEGAGAVEERARYELGMIKDGEVFVQIVDPPHAGPEGGPGTSPALPAARAPELKAAPTASPLAHAGPAANASQIECFACPTLSRDNGRI